MEFLKLLNEFVPSIGVAAIVVFGWKISGAIGELRGQMQGMQGQIGGLDTRMLKVEQEFHAIDKRLFKVEQEVHSVNGYLRNRKTA